MGAWYRLAQFWRIWQAKPLANEAQAAITAVLTASEVTLFSRQSLSDQQHSYRVLRLLQSAGHAHPDLLAAALLHDVGKARSPLSIWDRSLIVLMQRIAPKKTAVWGQSEARGWRRPFVVRTKHPAWGAEMAQTAGSRPLTITLIRRHQAILPETAVSEEDKLLRLLQWADDQN